MCITRCKWLPAAVSNIIIISHIDIKHQFFFFCLKQWRFNSLVFFGLWNQSKFSVLPQWRKRLKLKIKNATYDMLRLHIINQPYDWKLHRYQFCRDISSGFHAQAQTDRWTTDNVCIHHLLMWKKILCSRNKTLDLSGTNGKYKQLVTSTYGLIYVQKQS